MNKWIWGVLLVPLAASAQMPPREQLVAQAVGDYGSLFGGAAIDDRCGFLDEDRSAAFHADIGVITPALNQDIGDPALLNRALDAGLAEGASDKYADCGPKAREIVEATSGHARNWAEQIRQIQSAGE